MDGSRRMEAGHGMARSASVAVFVLSALSIAGCRSAPVRRIGVSQRAIVEGAYPVPMAALRLRLLESFAARSRQLPLRFRQMRATELKPQSYTSDWLEDVVDPGFILHFADSTGGGTTPQVFDKVPSVWPGMYWTFGHSGPGWYRDIRFVEPDG